MSLSIEKLDHHFSARTVLHSISLEVHPGEVLCLLGPSGCGKTTLLRLIAGLEDVQSGRILLDGRVMADGRQQLLPEQRGVGFVFQDLALFPHLTVLENAMFGLFGMKDPAQRRSKALGALSRVNMQDHAGVYPHELSGGQQQRVALARALAPDPRIMLLDEPFSSLDARLRVQIRDQTLHVLKESGVATVMVTHDPEEAMFMGDRIVLLREGRVVQIGTPVELYSRPSTPFVATFFSEVNTLHGTVCDGRVETVLGGVEVENLPDGTRVTLMFRPDAVQISTAHASSGHDQVVAAKVLATRLLPGATLVHLQVPDSATGHEVHLHARVPCVSAIPEGETVTLRVSGHLMHVFVTSDTEPDFQGC
jgi:iron(III) transport system ATP-binding protein